MMSNITRSLRPVLQRSLPSQTSRSMTVLSKSSGIEFQKQNYNDRMKKTGRPVSPHVTIYAFPITALSSITNRATGMGLSFGAAALGAVELIGGPGSALTLMEGIGSSGIAPFAKFAVAFPTTYHYLGGVRHLLWDKTPDYLTNPDVERASYVLVGSSVLISLGAAIM